MRRCRGTVGLNRGLFSFHTRRARLPAPLVVNLDVRLTLTTDAFERLSIRLYIHELASKGVPFYPIPCLRVLCLRTITHCTKTTSIS